MTSPSSWSPYNIISQVPSYSLFYREVTSAPWMQTALMTHTSSSQSISVILSPSTSSTRWSPPHDDQQGSLPSCSSTTFCHLSSWRRPTASTTSTSSTTSEQSYGLLMLILMMIIMVKMIMLMPLTRFAVVGTIVNFLLTGTILVLIQVFTILFLTILQLLFGLGEGFHNSIFNFSCDVTYLVLGVHTGFRRQFTVLLILTHLVLGPNSSRRLPPAMFLINCSIHNSFDVSNNKLFVDF